MNIICNNVYMYILATVFMHALQYCKAAVHSMIGSQSADWTWSYSKAIGRRCGGRWTNIMVIDSRHTWPEVLILAKIAPEMISEGVKFKMFIIHVRTYFNHACTSFKFMPLDQPKIASCGPVLFQESSSHQYWSYFVWTIDWKHVCTLFVAIVNT